MPSYLITGSARGLGLALVTELASDVHNVLFATGRTQVPSESLQKLINSSPGRVHYIYLDILDVDSITNSVKQVDEATNGHGLDVLINNAAIQVDGAEPASKAHALTKLFETNVVAVHNVITALLPLLKLAQEKKIVNITSELGSIGLSRSMAFIPKTSYKVSKAALNMLTVQYAYELESEGFTVFCMNPGHLKTELGGDGAELSVEIGARAVVDVIKQATSKDNGHFKNIYAEESQTCDGKDIPW